MSPDPPSQLHIFYHDCNPLCMDSTMVTILKQMYYESLRRLLQRLQGGRLPPVIEMASHHGDPLISQLSNLFATHTPNISLAHCTLRIGYQEI